MSPEALRRATIGPERVIELERSQRALVEAHLRDSAVDRGAFYVAAAKRFRDRGWGQPVAGCDWAPAPNIDPTGVPVIPEFLQREVKR